MDAEADLSLRLTHMLEGTFSHVTGQLLMLLPEIARMPGKTGINVGSLGHMRAPRARIILRIGKDSSRSSTIR